MMKTSLHVVDRYGLVVWLTLGATMLGCGPGNPLNRQPVSGRVTLDGQPLDSGRISFRPADAAHGIGSGAVIQQGHYEIDRLQGLPPGEYLVRIHAPQPERSTHTLTEELPPGTPVGQLGIERIPAKFNRDSNVTVEIAAGHTNVLDFEIVSDETESE